MLYRLEEAQAPAVNAAARNVADMLRKLSARYRDPEVQSPGSASYYEFRLQAERAQLAALKILENVMTPAQIERMRSLALTDFYVERSSREE